MDYPAGIISSYVNASGRRTHFLEAGNGEPLVLVHGSGPGASAWSGFRENISELAKHFHVYAIDTLGFGYTDKPTDILYSDQACVDHLRDFINAACLDKVLLIGHSRGAYMTAKYMLDNPDRVKKLMMVSSGSIALAMGLERTAGQSEAAKTLQSYDGTPESMRRALSVVVADRSKLTDELIKYRMHIAEMPGHKYVRESMRKYRSVLREDPNHQQLFDIRHRLPMVTIPTYLVWGGKDEFAPPSLAESLRKALPNVKIDVMKNGGHQCQTDDPAEFNRLAIQFLKS